VHDKRHGLELKRIQVDFHLEQDRGDDSAPDVEGEAAGTRDVNEQDDVEIVVTQVGRGR
jgi:hypothetical protein